MRNENEKSFVDKERLFYVTIYGRQHIYTCFRYYFLTYSILNIHFSDIEQFST